MRSQQTQLPAIASLPDFLINQIKAGEIVERPSGLIKELIENSVDAQATAIDLHIVNNGLDQIIVKDNGHGIVADQLVLAFGRHTTSKLRNFDDLFRLQSYGFRGEALASIAGVASVECTSFTTNPPGGGKLTIKYGILQQHIPLTVEEPAPTSGTTLNITGLFALTPARLKFVQSPISERNSINRIVNSFILACPHIRFSVKWDNQDDRLLYESLGTNEYGARLAQILQRPLKDSPIQHLQQSYQDYQLDLFTFPRVSSSKLKQNFIFVNQRLIEEKALYNRVHFILESLPGTTEMNYVAFFQVPMAGLDVNVHPNKTVVKFESPEVIYSLISRTLKNRHIQDSVRPQILASAEPALTAPSPAPSKLAGPSLASDPFPPLPPRFFITQTETTPLLIDCWRLRLWCWHRALLQAQTQEQTEGQWILPLLVSEPFANQTLDPKALSHLATIGLEFDRLNSQLLLLRSIPATFRFFTYQSLVNWVLTQAKNLPKSSGDQLIWLRNSWQNTDQHSPLETRDQMTTAQWQSLSPQLDQATLLQAGLAIYLDETQLLALFNGNRERP